MGRQLCVERPRALDPGPGAIGLNMEILLGISITAFLTVVSLDVAQHRRQNLKYLKMSRREQH